MNLITPAEVVEHAFTHREAISPHSIRRSKIDVVAERFVRPRFGDALYEKFVAREYEPFVDEYLKPAMAHYVRYAMVDELSIQMTENGAMLFESEETKSQRFKTVAAEVNEKNSSTQNQTTDSQQEVDSVKTIDSTLHATTDSTQERQNVQDDTARTTLAVTSEETLTRDSTATTNGDKVGSGTKNESTNDSTKTKADNQNDYNYHESPQTVGVNRIGYNHDVVDEQKTLTGTSTVSETAHDTSSSTQNQESTDLKNSKTDSSSVVDKDSSLVANQTSSQISEQDRHSNDTSSQSTSVSKSVANTKEELNDSIRRTADDDTGTSARSGSAPATDLQRRIIRARSLADANVLMSRAVRYVERNIELFPEYQPLHRSLGRFVL